MNFRSVLAILYCAPTFAQIQLNSVNGPVTVDFKFHKPTPKAFQGLSPVKKSAPRSPAYLAFFTRNYESLGGKQVNFHMVGTDPGLGAATTIIPTVLIPLKFIFSDPGNPVLDGTNVIPAIVNSPIFQATDYKSGSVDLGVTQYGDALQRAQFWNLPGFSKNYHVLLGTPKIAPTVTTVVPAGMGTTIPLSKGGYFGWVEDAVISPLIQGLLANYLPNELPIFVTDNVEGSV